MDDSWNDCLEGRREERGADAVRGGRATSAANVRAWVNASTAISPTAQARPRSATSITRRRSKRSLTVPPMSRQAISGTVIAIPITESASGLFQSE